MSTRRLLVLIVATISLSILLCVAVTTYWQWKQPVFEDAAKLVAAIQAFARDLTTRGQPLPGTVSLQDLVSGGCIVAHDVRAFDGMEVALSLAVDEAHPQQILIRVRLPDGSVIASRADGSVQSLRK